MLYLQKYLRNIQINYNRQLNTKKWRNQLKHPPNKIKE
jgi:hypothetical protein